MSDIETRLRKTTIIGVVKRVARYISGAEALITGAAIALVGISFIHYSTNRVSDTLSVVSISLTYVGFRLAVQLLLEQDIIADAVQKEQFKTTQVQSRESLMEELANLDALGREVAQLQLDAGIVQYREIVDRVSSSLAVVKALTKKLSSSGFEGVLDRKGEIDAYLVDLGSAQKADLMSIKATCISIATVARELSEQVKRGA